MSQATASLKVGDPAKQITVTTDPADASDSADVLKAVTWSSSDPAVATVAENEITAVAAGTATITATSGEFTATVKVTVSAAE